jgi:predicted kinase
MENSRPKENSSQPMVPPWSRRSVINCLEESDALLPAQFPDALRVYMEMVKSRKGDVSDMTLAVLHDIRMATLN